jgi:hypothetical protein
MYNLIADETFFEQRTFKCPNCHTPMFTRSPDHKYTGEILASARKCRNKNCNAVLVITKEQD